MELTMLEKLEQMRAFLEVEVKQELAPPVQTQATRLLLEWAVRQERALREPSTEDPSASTPNLPSSNLDSKDPP